MHLLGPLLLGLAPAVVNLMGEQPCPDRTAIEAELRLIAPGITDSPASLEAVVRAAAAAGARHIFGGPLFLKPCSAAVFLPFLAQHFPELVENYRTRYQERSFLPASYGKRIAQLIASLRQKYGIKRADPRGASGLANQWPMQSLNQQLPLF